MTYPIMLDVANKQAVVIGGGKVAERKIHGLLEARAVVTVVSPEVTDALYQLAKEGELVWKQKTFSADDISSAFIVIAATNNSDVNEAVAQAATPNQLLNVVDAPEKSNFHVPAIVRQGRLTIAVSTGGASPILAKQIRRQMAAMYDEHYGRYVDFLYNCRQYILTHIKDPMKKQKLLQTIATEEFRKKGNWEEAFGKLLQHDQAD
ncbi:NAD(P)-binding protein [Anoxybacteroides tepidamans]|uniref:NAD(P)-binding protein n=1 Tax=Anoxybacteroides tepidamans TaxID=265948 RepID=UPI000485D840|nr:NAD(P)-binding protein [Anoxybacillus tepidamans]